MWNIRKFEIVLDNPYAVFYPGQYVKGQVIIEVAENMKMKGIFISCISAAKVFWQAGKQSYKGTEDYLNLKQKIYGDADDSNDVTLLAGSHAIPFQFLLPINLPGSFEGDAFVGCVRHLLKAVADRSRKVNREHILPFTVASVLDLNAIENVDGPLECKISETSSCYGCCCHSGTIKARFRLDRSGYVPGETLAIYGEVEDFANIGIKSTVVTLSKRLIYTSSIGSIYEFKSYIVSLRHGRVEPGGVDAWNGDKITIPSVPPSYVAGCNIIDVQYGLEVIIRLTNSCKTVRLGLPLVIGTVPLNSVAQEQLERTQYESQQNAVITSQPQRRTVPSPVTPAADFELPPPSYQECVLNEGNPTDNNKTIMLEI